MQVKKAYLEHINNNLPGKFNPEDVEFEELIARPHATTKVLQAYVSPLLSLRVIRVPFSYPRWSVSLYAESLPSPSASGTLSKRGTASCLCHCVYHTPRLGHCRNAAQLPLTCGQCTRICDIVHTRRRLPLSSAFPSFSICGLHASRLTPRFDVCPFAAHLLFSSTSMTMLHC